MFRAFYNISYNPFEKEASNITFESKDYLSVKNRFDYLMKLRGLGLFTGNPGNGKTYTFKKLIDSYNPNLYKFIYIRVNSRIKTIMKTANGYRNFNRLRNRIIYSINKQVPMQGNPIKSKK